jgi:hypothetical protein
MQARDIEGSRPRRALLLSTVGKHAQLVFLECQLVPKTAVEVRWLLPKRSFSARHVTNQGLGAFSVHAVLLNTHNFLGLRYDEISNLPFCVCIPHAT